MRMVGSDVLQRDTEPPGVGGAADRWGYAARTKRLEGRGMQSTGDQQRNPFDGEVRIAVLRHMNEDHLADSLLIVQRFGNRPDATSAVMVEMDGTGGEFSVDGPDGRSTVRVPWARPITERSEIREELARLVGETQGR